MHRRHVLHLGALTLGGAALAGCDRLAVDAIEGGFAGVDPERGHALRGPMPERITPAVTHRVRTVIAGGGVAGLAAARGLRLAGHEDFALLELEDEAGGNSRGLQLGGLPCPRGAHYLPVPGDDAREVQDLLEELGLRRRVAGRWVYDERHLCHSPQERLFFRGAWQEGLLPVQDVGESTLAQYRRFGALVDAARRAAHYAMPIQKAPLVGVQSTQDALVFEAWLTQHGLTDPLLRWYLDYCCRDDFGAGIDTVSAWAGVHYFASRHGFHAPGDRDGAEGAERDAVLTWPEGNGWLSARLAAPLGDRLHTARVVRRIAAGRHGVEIDAWDARTQRWERWQAAHAIVALPVHVAARVLDPMPEAVRQINATLPHAAWVVSNLQLRAPLRDRPGAAPSWDNVVHGAPGLGYVNATHQSLQPVPGATVLTHYRALGTGLEGRRALLERPWTAWRDAVLAELAAPHPDLAQQTVRMAVTRYGHAMAVPAPGIRALIDRLSATSLDYSLWKKKQLRPLVFPGHARLAFAHADWSGYSVFEEAFTLGHAAGRAVALA